MGIRREEEMEMSDDDMEDMPDSKDSDDSGSYNPLHCTVPSPAGLSNEAQHLKSLLQWF